MKCMVSYIQWFHEMNNGRYFESLLAIFVVCHIL